MLTTNWTVLLTALQTLTLGREIALKTVLAPREAKVCKPAPSLTVTPDAKPTSTASAISFRVTIENPTDKPIEICLMPFSVISSPLLMFSLRATSGLEDPPRLPEVYPITGEKIAFQIATLPAHTRVAVGATQPIPRPSYAKAKDLKLSWSLILNHDYRGGDIALHP